MPASNYAVRPASETQVGGNHYKNFRIQPGEFLQRVRLDWLRANAIKYLARHRQKNGAEDLKKAAHYLQLHREWGRPTLGERFVGWLRASGFRSQYERDFLAQFPPPERAAIEAVLCGRGPLAELMVDSLLYDHYLKRA